MNSFDNPLGESGDQENQNETPKRSGALNEALATRSRAWRSSRTKRKALGQQFQGLQSTTSSGGYDIAAYAEVHCNGKDDVNKYANDINPAGRSYSDR